MLKDLVVHKQTLLKLTAYLSDTPQAIVLIGPVGIGKLTLAKAWAEELASEPGQMQIIEPDDKGTIGIDAVRDLYRQTRNKQVDRQIIIIDNAHALGIEAQNAFLKLLEEPRSGLTFVLTAQAINDLLPTVTSRLEIVNVIEVSDQALGQMALSTKSDLSEVLLKQLLFIANGRPATVARLTNSDELLSDELAKMSLAKQLLTAKLYDRFLAINQLAQDRQRCRDVLSAMLRMSALQLCRADKKTIDYWSNRVLVLELTLDRLTNNGNVKAQLLNAFASFA